MDIGFSSYTGTDFLIFYGALIVAAVVAGVWIAHFIQPEGTIKQVDDSEELAYLAGGNVRLTESTLANLFATDRLNLDKREFIPVAGQAGASAGENALLGRHSSFKWAEAQRALKSHAQQIDRKLVRAALLVPENERFLLRLLPTTPYIFLLVLGAYRWMMGNAEGEPVGFLTGMMILTLVLALIRFSTVSPRTSGGDIALREARANSERIRNTPQGHEVGVGVALFGTGILAGTPYAPVHAARPQGDGGSSGNDSDGDGGGCGGGCGGCG